MELSDLAFFKATPAKNSRFFVRMLCKLITGFGYGVTVIVTGYLLEVGMQLARTTP